jgi:hypothetical protein
VVVAAALVVALVITGRLLNVPSSPAPVRTVPVRPAPSSDLPYRIGGQVVCPLSRPVLAASDGHSYPPGYPTPRPPDAHPVGCYDTVDQAATAG